MTDPLQTVLYLFRNLNKVLSAYEESLKIIAVPLMPAEMLQVQCWEILGCFLLYSAEYTAIVIVASKFTNDWKKIVLSQTCSRARHANRLYIIASI